MEMDQIEEFDSTSSSSSASSASESSSNESSGGEEEEGDTCSSFGEAGGEGDVSDSQEDDSSSASDIRRIAMVGGAAGGSGTTVASHGGPRSSYRAERSLKPTEAAGGRRRKRLRKRKATGLRKKLRTHIESVDEFNPEARSAQSAELDRLRRLQLQQGLTAASFNTNQHPHHQSAVPQPQALIVAPPTMPTGQIQLSSPQAASNIKTAPMAAVSQQIYTSPMQRAGGEASVHIAGPSHVQLSSSAQVQGGVTTPTGDVGGVSVARCRSDSSSSPEVLMVDLTYTAKMGEPQRRVEDAIVIDSGSDSDNTAGNNTNEQGRPQAAVAKQQISGGGEVASVVPTTTQFGSGSGGASAVAMPTRSELLNMKYGEILPSPDGRVLVNAGHTSSEEDVYLAPQIARTVKPHQIGGIRFLYDNIVESLTRFSSSPGFGCILAHSMGLGKTLQVIGFIEVLFRCTPAKHVLCVVPVNTLQNWIGEFEHWVPPPPSPSSTASAAGQSNRSSSSSSASGVALLTNQNPLWGQVTPLATTVGSTAGDQSKTDDIRYRTFNISILSEANRTMDSRLKVIREWRRIGGVLLLGYEMYRLLSLSVPSLGGNKMAVKKKKSLVVKAPAGGTIDLDETEREMEALIEIQKALCNPGPDLVVCDEGHRIKNDYSNISQALKRIRTRRRIVMTGYPLQNNLTEYWCMVDFVRPSLLGTKQEFADLFERPITNGQCMDSTPMDVRLMRYRSHVLHSLLEGFVLRKGHEILKSTLPPKVEHVLYLRPSKVQGDLYDFNMSAIAQAAGNSNSAGPLKAFAVCSKIWNHPDIYYQEAMTQKRSKTISPTTWLDQEGQPKTLLSAVSTSSSAAKGSSSSSESTCRIDWPTSDIPNYQPGVLENSPKMVILAELIDRSVHVGDKILIFSQNLNTLSYIEKMLSQRQIPISNSNDPTGQIQYSSLKWTKNKNYCRLDGSTNSIERDRLINNFNAAGNYDCWVFLLSTKAGCLGINLIGANRVVVTDVSWNPCYDSQAVCRVYRYGQTKPCYIYRLVCDGTMERKIYDRQISKQSMSNRVVDELHPERHLTSQDILKLIMPLAQLPPPSDLSAHAMEYFFDPLLMEICSRHGQLLTKLPFKHESLLLDSEEERMTEVEKYIAMKGFQQHLKLIRSNPSNQQSGQGGGGGGGGYRPQPSSLPRPQASQVRPQASQVKPQTQTGQVRATQPVSRPFPIPPVPEATPSTSGMMKRGGTMMAAPVISTPSSEKVEVICLDSDEEDNGDDRPVAVIRGEVPIITAANDPISLLQSPTHLQSPSLSSQTTNDLLPTSTSAQTPPTSSAHTDSSSALNLNTSFNNSIPPWIDMLMAVTEDPQQRNFLLQAANMYLQETSSYSQPVAMATSPTDNESAMMIGQSSQSVPDVAANVNVFSDVAACATLQSFIQAQGTNTYQQVNNGEVHVAAAASSNSTAAPLSSPPPLTSPRSPPPTTFQRQTQVYGSTTPHSSLPQASNAMMSSTPIMTSSSPMSNGVGPLPTLCSQGQMSQVRVKLEHSPNSLSLPPSNNTFHANKSPSVSPEVQSSPSRYTSSPSSSSSSASLSPPSPSPLHQTPQSPINKTPESSLNTCLTPSLPPSLPPSSVSSLLTCGSSSSCSTQSTDSLKLKRSKSHSAPVRHLATTSPLRKTQSSSSPKSYSLSQKFHSSLLLNDDNLTAVIGARSTSVSPTSTLSPSQSNSSDCNSPPERPSKPQNHQSDSPPTRLDSSVTFRYSSSPSPSNTPSAPYTPCSIPLLSPVAARLLYLSTGTKLPSSPPEDVDKLPPIINRKPVKKEGHGCATSLASALKKESGSSAGSLSPSSAEKKHHHSDKKKRKGSSLAKSMELVPMSTDITPESFFTSNQMTSSSSVTTPTSAPPPHPLQVTASSSCVTTPSPVDPPAMQCSSLPLRRNSCDSFKKVSTTAGALASPTAATTVANLWALKSQPQLTNNQPVTASHVSSTEQLLSNIFKMTSSSKSLTAVNSSSTVVSRSLATAQVSTLSTMLSAAVAQNSNLSTVLAAASARCPTSSTGLVSASKAVQSTSAAVAVPPSPLASTPAKSPALSLSSRGTAGTAFSISSSISPKVPATTPTITHGPSSSTLVGRNRGSALTTAAANKALNVSPSCLSQSKTTTITAVGKNSSVSSPYLSHSHSKTTLPTWSSTSQQCSPTTHSMSSTPAAAGGIALSSLPLPPPSSQAAASSSLAQSNISNVNHNGLTSPTLSAVLSGTSTSVPSAFALSNAARLPQSSAQKQTVSVPQRVNSNSGRGITSPTTLSSAYSTGMPAAPSSLGTSGVKLGHAQNHHPATAVSMTTAVGGATMSPISSTVQSSIQNSAQSARQYTSSCSPLTTTPTLSSSSSSTAVIGEMSRSVVDESTTMAINLPPLPEGLEHRVVSGLLQAEPPVALNKLSIQDSAHKSGVKKNEAPAAAAAAFVTSGGYGVVTNGGVAHTTVSSASCGPTHRPRVRNSSSSSSCDSNLPLLSPASINSSKVPNANPPYTKNHSVTSGQKLMATKPSPPSQSPMVSSAAHSVKVTRPSNLAVSSTQAQTTVLPSPTVAISTNQLPSLNGTSRRNSSSLEMPIGDNGASLASNNMAAVNINDFLTSECATGTLILSPTQLLSPSSLQSPPAGSTTLPDPLKTFIFPISLSPPIERRQLSTSPAQNGFSALQSVNTHQEQHQKEQKQQLPIRGSLRSPDHRHGNSPVPPINRQQSQESLLSPTLQRSNTDIQRNSTLVQQRSRPVVAQDARKESVPSLSPTQHKSRPVVAVPNSQRNSSFMQQRSKTVLPPSPHDNKSGPSFSGNQQRSRPDNLASNQQGSTQLRMLSPTKLEQRSGPTVPSPDQQKCGASSIAGSGGQRPRMLSSNSAMTTVHNGSLQGRSIAPKPQQKVVSPVVVPTAQRNGWDVMQSLLLSPPPVAPAPAPDDCRRSSSAPSQSDQPRGSTVIVPSSNSQRNGTILPSFDKKNNVVSPGSQMSHLLTPSSVNQRGSPVVSSSQQRNNTILPLPPQVDCGGVLPADNNKNGAIFSPPCSMPMLAQQKGTNVTLQAPTPPTSLNSYSMVNSASGLLSNNSLSLAAHVSQPMTSCSHHHHQRRSSTAVLPPPSQMNTPSVPPPPPVNNASGNSLLSPTVLTSPVPFSNHQASSGMLLSSSPSNSQMSIHHTSSSDGAHYLLSAPNSQVSGSVPPAACSQQKGGAAARRKSTSSDQPRNGSRISPELQKSGPSLSRKSQQMSPVVVPSAQKKTGGGKSSTDKKKSKNRKLSSSSHQKKNTVQPPTSQRSCNNSQPASASNTTQRSNTPLLPSLSSQRNGSTMPLSHQRNSPVHSSSSSPLDLQRSNTASLNYSHQNGTCTLPVSSLPSCQRNSTVTVARPGNNPLLSPDCLKHSTVPSSTNQLSSAAVTLATIPQTTSTAPPPVFSRDAQNGSAFPMANIQSTSAAESLSTSQRNGAMLTPSFSFGGGFNTALPSSNHQMSSPASSTLSSYQKATASNLPMTSPAALVNTPQKSSATNPTYTSLNMTNSGNGLSLIPPHSVSVTISNRLPPPPCTNSPNPGAINNVLTCTSPSPVQSTPPSFVNRPVTAAANDGSTHTLRGLSSAVCPGGSVNSCAPVTVSGGFASAPQSNGVTTSNGLVSSTPYLTSTPSLGTPLHQQPPTLKASPSQQGETVLPQNGSMSSVSPSWDAATLSLLSDLFSSQPLQGQRCSENSQPKQLQAQPTSVALPSMDGDQLINEFLTNSQSQNPVSNHPQASVSLPNAANNDDASSIINDLLSNSQNPNLVPKCPRVSVNQPGMGGGGQVMKEPLSSSRNSPPSQNVSKKQSAVRRPQSLVNGQRSSSSATHHHPLMRVSSPTTNGRLPQQQKNGPSLPKQQQNQNGPSLVEKGPQNIHSWQQSSGSLQTQLQEHRQQQNGLLPQQQQNGLLLQQQQNGLLSQQQQNGSLSQYQQKCPLPQQNGPLPQLQLQQNGSSLQLQRNDQLSRSHQNGPISQQQLNGTFSQPQQNGSLSSQHQLNTSLPHQQFQQKGPLSRDGMMLWEQNDLLSSSSNLPPCRPQSHPAAAISSPCTNNSSGSPMQLMSSSNNVLQSPQLGGFQILPTSSSPSCSSETRGQLQQLLSPPPSHAGGLPSLPKLTPLPSQPPMVGSNQAPFAISTAPSNQVSAGPAASQQQLGKQFGGCSTTPPTDGLMSKSVPLSVSAPQQSSVESTLNTQNTINLLSILNSLSPSQLESLLDSATKDGQPSPMSFGNGRQENKHSSIGDNPPAIPHSQNTLTNFPNQNFGSPIPPNLPSHLSTPAASYRESHDAAKPKVAMSTGLPQFTVRSSCTSTELRGQLLQLEPTAAVMHGGYDSNATAGSVSALRLHSHQIN